MELKVWVDGIQRVVCGVNEATTCQDVVYALAHATGQTGRFTLVEKWRHCERLLPPQEHPLMVLTKWGEYASDVQLILRRSPDRKAQNNISNHLKNVPNKKLLLNDMRPFSPPNTLKLPHTAAQNKEIKKSLTFSGSHGSTGSSNGSGSTPSTPQNSISASKNSTNVKIEHGWDLQDRGRMPNRLARLDVPRGIVKGIPQEKCSPTRPRQPPSYDEAVSRSSRHSTSSQLTPFNATKDSKRQHVRAGSQLSSMTSKDFRLSPTRNSDAYFITTHTQSDYKRESILNSPFLGSSPTDNPWSVDKSRNKKNLVEEFKESPSKIERESASEMKISKDSHSPQYKDLIQLITLQREKLINQNAELSQFDAEVVYWEGRLEEQESRLTVLEDDIRRLETLNKDQCQELMILERTEGMEGPHQDEKLLRSKLSVAKAQLDSFDMQLTHARHRLKHLGDEVSEERNKIVEHEKEAEERENQSQEMKKQMNRKEEEETEQLETLRGLEKELHVLEEGLSERQNVLEKLTLDLREANLQALSLTIADDIKCLSEGNLHTRSGSTRRIVGSPRQLENAVPTSKNPHGVWV